MFSPSIVSDTTFVFFVVGDGELRHRAVREDDAYRDASHQHRDAQIERGSHPFRRGPHHLELELLYLGRYVWGWIGRQHLDLSLQPYGFQPHDRAVPRDAERRGCLQGLQARFAQMLVPQFGRELALAVRRRALRGPFDPVGRGKGDSAAAHQPGHLCRRYEGHQH
jgi:hypothetical protein